MPKLPARKRMPLWQVTQFIVAETSSSKEEAGTRLVQALRDGDLIAEAVEGLNTAAEKVGPIPRGKWIHFNKALLFGDELRLGVMRLGGSSFDVPDIDKVALQAWLIADPTPAPELAASHGEQPPIATGSPVATVSERRPRKAAQVEAKMKADIASGRLTLEDLRSMLEKKMEVHYGVSRDTARKARLKVLSENVESRSTISTNDK